jgi:hypothetical protein
MYQPLGLPPAASILGEERKLEKDRNKKKAGAMLGVAAGLANFIPGAGQIASPLLGIASQAVTGFKNGGDLKRILPGTYEVKGDPNKTDSVRLNENTLVDDKEIISDDYVFSSKFPNKKDSFAKEAKKYVTSTKKALSGDKFGANTIAYNQMALGHLRNIQELYNTVFNNK